MLQALTFSEHLPAALLVVAYLLFGTGFGLVNAPITLREPAERMTTDPPCTTVVVDDPVRCGLAERITNPADRRSKLVHVTDAGQAAARALDILTTPPDALLALLAEDIEALDRVVAKLLG